MTRQVALAEATYRRLKAAKRKGESFSDVIERLLTYQPKDPMRFLRSLPRAPIDTQEWLAQIERDREATRFTP